MYSPSPVRERGPGGEVGKRGPEDLTNYSAQRPPPPLVLRQYHALLTSVHQVRTEDRTDPRRLGGALEFDRAIDAVGVSASEGGEATRGSGRDQFLRARGALAEGEVGVGVEVDEHGPRAWRDETTAEPLNNCN